MSTETKPSSSRIPILARVVSTRELTPHMIRIDLESDGLAGFPVGEFTDHYVKLQFPPPGASYGPPFDPAEIRETLPREQWHRQRTYTVRAADPEVGRITIDFVTHGSGLAGLWAASARIGDPVQMIGPGGAYTPDPGADWHLMAGDEAVIPAISVALGRVPAGVPVFVVLEVEDEAEQQALETNAGLTFPEGAEVIWLHRNGAAHTAEPRILRAVESLQLPVERSSIPDPASSAGHGQAFVHGEAGMVREVRRHLANERGMELAALSATGYWKYRRTEEGWREDKPEWKRLAELDLAPEPRPQG